ncbi:MAG TPA: metal-dependent hydrolase [Pyrinomonadaceae bacterium]|nr:metal-dependent hydrolase [Pyrinomonadaceae bacterium]
MDNLTHSLVGLAASKAGLEKLSPHASLCSIVAANAPDSDISIILFGDRWTYLEHHRGVTHSIIGTLVLALFVPLLFYGLDRFISRLRGRAPTIKVKGLLVTSLIVSATHPLLDWTNNYGVRPLLPWTSKWFYGDLVFIVDPFMWLMFGGACFLLAKTRRQVIFWLLLAIVLTYLVIAMPARRGIETGWPFRVLWIIAILGLAVSFMLNSGKRWGSRLAVAAFAMVGLYIGSLALLHQAAVSEVREQARAIANQNGESVTDLAAMPTLANPFNWLCIVETEFAAYRFELSLLRGQNAAAGFVRHERGDISNSPAVERVWQDRRAQIFLRFARFPVVQVVGADCLTETLVQFADLRYTQPGSTRGTFSLELPVECPTGPIVGSEY